MPGVELELALVVDEVGGIPLSKLEKRVERCRRLERIDEARPLNDQNEIYENK